MLSVTPDIIVAATAFSMQPPMSMKRWSVRDSMGLKLAAFLKEYRVVDSRTFEIVLKERFGALLEAIGKPSVVDRWKVENYPVLVLVISQEPAG